MKPFAMWVLYRKGEVRRDQEGYLFFDTREQALTYWKCCVSVGDNGWKPKRVMVSAVGS